MPPDPMTVWGTLRDDGLAAALFFGMLALAAALAWVMRMYVKERDARTADIKANAVEAKDDLRNVLTVNADVAKSLDKNIEAVTALHVKMDGLGNDLKILSARIDPRR